MRKLRPVLWLLPVLIVAVLTVAWVTSPRRIAEGLNEINSRAAPSLDAAVEAKRVLVIGGTSGVGLETVKLALARGHEVTVMSRRGEIELPESPSLRVIKGDIRDPQAVDRAVAGQDAVIVSISAPPGRQAVSVFSEGARNVIEAMRDSQAKRLLVVTGVGAGESRGRGGFGYDNVLQPLLLAENYKDKEREEALVRDSGLDWTIVRPGFLTDDESAGAYRIAYDLEGVTSGSISRADVAHYLVAALESDLDRRRAVLLSN